ncbi:MAG: hypothetical protein COV31_00190 [Candidatus Yanofskybacteria bacterium CG10_big_fil_rev_8_21_14_0_10_46_23]|uniref:Methyltransferase n=1 Tax=Candidatus Yanofskybacteria bacterium CG10_big_fil_rev_8_21_14_0_10_46_23 TaxID=1975098 RepID=A0A2H0R6H9_9BACT|nr:MAG: hypothetical protein COV31_00190 [Candidatus Yanofskybacteria bacterium CG10_big_fil_rev_8_21_14_0_10_46_23]
MKIKKIKSCRICKSHNLATFLIFKPMPKPNGFLKKPIKETNYPLEVSRCANCGLLQLNYVINAPEMFEHYLYMTAMSKTMNTHLRGMAKDITKRFDLKSGSSVIDVGGNDGTFLSHFKGSRIRTLNMDPAKNLKAIAAKNGVENYVSYFGEKSAKKVLKKYGPADVITGTNVFAHIDDLDDVFRGVDILLKPGGILLMEFPYLVDLVEKNEFDTIYHEHLSYFLAKPLELILARHGFEIFDLQRFTVHGGSIRLYVQRIQDKFYPISPKVEALYHEEKNLGMYKRTTYDKFARNIKSIPKGLNAVIKQLKAKNKRIIGYGASAKGNVLLNMCGLGPDDLEYIVDSTPYKQGLFTPGSHIPIVSEEYLDKDNPDYAVLFIWNFKDEVLKKQKNRFIRRGGHFIVPVPHVMII